MKKIFTLIAAISMVASAYAQEQYVIAKEFVPTANQKVEATTNTAVTYGNESGWKASNPANGGFIQGLGYEGGVSGASNPKDDDTKSYSPEKQNLPTTGVYYIIETKKAGTVTVAMKLGANKAFYVIHAEDGAAVAGVSLEGADGAITLDADNKWSVGGECTATFPVEAGKSYYVFCTGSKLTYYGHTFAEDVTAIESVTAAKAAKADALYNLAGQRVGKNYRGIVIENGVKKVQK